MTTVPQPWRGYGEALAKAGCHRPTLLIDADRLDRNIARIRTALDPSLSLRLVDKSLAIPALIEHLLAATGATRLMTFHLPVTIAMLEAFDVVTLLFGKPMPIAAIAEAFRTAGPKRAEALSRRVTWLVDTPARIMELADLATSLGLTLDVAFEINVGLNRGGFADMEGFRTALGMARASAGLRVQGVMGYEVHIPSVPRPLGGPKRARAEADRRFAAFAECLAPEERVILNTGGSKTALSYRPPHPANEVSIGSAFLLPTDFDGGLLADLEPALFIATPVLKAGPALMPGTGWLTPLVSALGLFPKAGMFLYGGKWMARPVWPPSMKASGIWGESSNQSFMGVDATELPKPGDMVFFRPTQSEAVLQHFGPVALYRDGAITGFWTPLPTG